MPNVAEVVALPLQLLGRDFSALVHRSQDAQRNRDQPSPLLAVAVPAVGDDMGVGIVVHFVVSHRRFRGKGSVGGELGALALGQRVAHEERVHLAI